MTTELYLARRLVEGRVHSSRQDRALLRNIELARKSERRRRRNRSRR